MTINNIEVAGFFCRVCLEEKATVRQSSDPRLCNDCFDYLSKEAESGRSGWWVPRQSDKPIKERARKDKSINATIKRLEQKAVSLKRGGIAANKNRHQTASPSVMKPVTLKSSGEPPEGDNVTARVSIQRVTGTNRNDRIIKLSSEGKKTREIAKVVGCSHMTVARIIAGQRELM